MKNLTAVVIASFLSLIFSAAAHAEDAGLSAVRLNQEGVLFLKAQNFTGAQDRFIRALGQRPSMAELHINLGLAFEGLQQSEKAQASFETAIRIAKADELKFVAYFNLGELFGKAKKIDQALVAYQSALDLKPDSRETKVNIELLIQEQDKNGKGGDSKDDKEQDQKDKQDQKKDPKDSKDNKDDKDDDKKDEKEGDKPKQYEKSKPQPKPFKSDELTQGDVNKILGELKQQEQKIRAEFNRREAKEKPRDKDW